MLRSFSRFGPHRRSFAPARRAERFGLSMRVPVRASLGLALAVSLFSCRYDPVPQEVIDSLGPEQGTPDENHRPGQPCVVCHGPYGGVAPKMAFAGTLFAIKEDALIPAPGVNVEVFDSSGDSRKACSKTPSGNFYLEAKDWEEVAFPLTVVVGSGRMTSLIGRDASCGSCHKGPDPENPDSDPFTGKSRESAGLITVAVDDIGTGDCGGGP